jgi:hypothetical protein
MATLRRGGSKMTREPNPYQAPREEGGVVPSGTDLKSDEARLRMYLRILFVVGVISIAIALWLAAMVVWQLPL